MRSAVRLTATERWSDEESGESGKTLEYDSMIAVEDRDRDMDRVRVRDDRIAGS